MSTILIGADICPIGQNREAFIAGDARALFNDLLPEFQAADLSIVNLECPFIERPSPIFKTGPTFGESGDCVRGIRNAGISVVNLANNHIMDHGEPGLRHTMRVCAEAGIAAVGAGENIQAARRIVVRDLNGLRVGILSMAEHEFSIAGPASWGANPLDLADFVRNVRDSRGQIDYLIVLLHGGDEFHAYPSPRIQDTCRFLIEMGANFVAVQHAHCLGGHESYQGGHIVYGQGAVIMDEAIYRDLKTFHEGCLVKLTVRRDVPASLEMIPFRQSDGHAGARRMSTEEGQVFLAELATKSRSILDDDFVRSRWLDFCRSRRHAYMSTILGHNRILRVLNARGLLERLLHGRRPLLGTRNALCCETHREALETIFNCGLNDE